MTQKETLQEFYRFLRERGVYTDYMNGLAKRHGQNTQAVIDKFLENHPYPDEWVNIGLTWSTQPIRHAGTSWEMLHQEWPYYLQDLENNEKI